MIIQTYPTTPVPSYSYIMAEKYQTLASPYQGQNEQRLRLARFPKRSVTLKYDKADIDSAWATLHNFFKARFGGWESFWFLDIRLRPWTDEYVGRGTGAALTLDLHSKTTDLSTLIIYEDAVAQVKDVDYTFISGGGEAGVDRITWIAGHYPALGALITADHKGLLRIKACLPDDWADDWYKHLRTRLELKLREVQW